MAEKDIILEEKTTEEKTTAETNEEVKEETPLEDVVLETEGGTKSLLGATSETGDIAATSLDTKTTPAGTDNLILFNQNTNVGYQIDYDNLADAILNKITSKTYANQVGGSSAATLLAQLSTLNSNISNIGNIDDFYLRVTYSGTSPATITYTAVESHTFILIGYNNFYVVSVPYWSGSGTPASPVVNRIALTAQGSAFTITRDGNAITVTAGSSYQPFALLFNRKDSWRLS